MDMLCFNDQIGCQARYPNYDSTAIRFNGVSADATSPERVKTWAHPETGFLQMRVRLSQNFEMAFL